MPNQEKTDASRSVATTRRTRPSIRWARAVAHNKTGDDETRRRRRSRSPFGCSAGLHAELREWLSHLRQELIQRQHRQVRQAPEHTPAPPPDSDGAEVAWNDCEVISRPTKIKIGKITAFGNDKENPVEISEDSRRRRQTTPSPECKPPALPSPYTRGDRYTASTESRPRTAPPRSWPALRSR